MPNFPLIFLIIFGLFLYKANSSIQDYYCGYKNCYKLLNVSIDATQQEIRKSYRELSKIYHPDKARARGGNDTTEIFKEINQAYDVLNNPEVRSSYDEYLAHPEKADLYHYYNWYKATYMPQLDPKKVVLAIIVAFSILQYVIRKSMHEYALSCIEKTSKFKTRLNESKEEIRKEMRQNIKIEGGYSDIKITDVLLIKLTLLPIKLLEFFYFHIRWIYKFSWKKCPYGDKEKEYMTYYRLGLSKSKWENFLTEEQRIEYLSQKIWDDVEFQKFIEKQEQQRQEKFASSARYKQYKRLLKNKKI